MGFLAKFLPPEDRRAALMLYGMVFATCFNGFDAGIMTVILADKQFIDYYGVDANKRGVIATIPWATTGLAQLFVGGTLANLVGRLWALRISMSVTPQSAFWKIANSVKLLDDHRCCGTSRSEHIWRLDSRPSNYV
jgi:hypothetical protein